MSWVPIPPLVGLPPCPPPTLARLQTWLDQQTGLILIGRKRLPHQLRQFL